MAPSKRPRDEQRLQAAIESGQKVLRLLKGRSAIPPTLVAELESHTRKSLPSLPATTIAAKSQALDALGTELWNASSCFIHTEDAPRDPRVQPAHATHVSVALRMFAMLLLDASHRASTRRSQDRGQKVRLFKVTLRAARLCLDHNQLESAVTALEHCSYYLPPPPDASDLLEISPNDSDDDDYAGSLKLSEGEYYLLRVLHAWKSQRLDLADHFYHSMSGVKIPECPESQVFCVKIADLCHEIAQLQSKAKETAAAITWSERALAALDRHDDEGFGQDALELRLSISVALVDQLLASEQEHSRHRALEIVGKLEDGHNLGNRIALPILKFRVLAHAKQADVDQISDTLRRLVHLVVLTEENFKIVMQTLRKAEQLVGGTALRALGEFICDRILPEVRAAHAKEPQIVEWLEKATITFILTATTSKEVSFVAQYPALKEILDRITQANGVQFSTRATHAAQTLLWKATGGLNEPIPFECCKLLQHQVFELSGHMNKSRIGRRLMRIALKHNDIPSAREAFFNMPAASQNDPASAYIAFKLALQSNDQDLASTSLRAIVKQTDRDPAFLYASVLDAQQSKMKNMALAALKAIIEQKPPGVQLATLFRCTARLLIAEMDTAQQDINLIAQEVVSIFEMSAKSIDEMKRLPEEQKRSELLWWSKNAYNLTLRFCPSVHPELIYRMMAVCLQFLDHIPKDAGLMHATELSKRQMLCLFLSTTAMIILGRSNDMGEEYTLQCFLKARENIATFRTRASTLSSDDQDDDTRERTFIMLKYELECILKLQRWDELPAALQTCIDTPHTGRWDTLADLIIIVHSQLDSSTTDPRTSELITNLLQKIINETWKKDKDMIKVSRWLRFTFSLCLKQQSSSSISTSPSSEDSSFSLKLLQQAALMAEKGETGKQQQVYPDAELRWLATTGFNHAVDLISEAKFEVAMKWMETSLEVARWCADNGQLHKMLSEARERAKERVDRALVEKG